MSLTDSQGGACLIYKPVLEALGLGHQLLCAAVSVACWSGVPDEVPVIDLKDDSLNQACTTGNTYSLLDNPQVSQSVSPN